jgi:hypothetical protein
MAAFPAERFPAAGLPAIPAERSPAAGFPALPEAVDTHSRANREGPKHMGTHKDIHNILDMKNNIPCRGRNSNSITIPRLRARAAQSTTIDGV